MTKLEDILWNIDSAYCFVLNGSSSDLHEEIENEYQDNVSYINDLYTQNQKNIIKLNNIKELLSNRDDNISKKIMEILNG